MRFQVKQDFFHRTICSTLEIYKLAIVYAGTLEYLNYIASRHCNLQIALQTSLTQSVDDFDLHPFHDRTLTRFNWAGHE